MPLPLAVPLPQAWTLPPGCAAWGNAAGGRAADHLAEGEGQLARLRGCHGEAEAAAKGQRGCEAAGGDAGALLHAAEGGQLARLQGLDGGWRMGWKVK